MSRRGRIPLAAGPSRRHIRRGLPATNYGAENRPPMRLRQFCAARREPNLGGQVAARDSEAALPPLGLTVPAKGMRQGTRDMLIASEGEEIVCPKGTVCGRITRDANDQIVDGDFAAGESSLCPPISTISAPAAAGPVAVREPLRWRVHLRRGWVR